MVFNMVLTYFNKIYEFLLVAIIIINIYQRKIPHTNRKRTALLLWAMVLLALYIFLFVRAYRELPSWLDWISIAIATLVIIIFRKRFLPFRLHCTSCGKRLGFSEIIGGDENLCASCFEKEFPDEKKKEERKIPSSEEEIERKCIEASKVDEVPWESWEPTERCVLTYLFDNDNVLLIEKKRGMGTGYYNAPGGHIEIEETKFEAAIRETKEETGLDVSDLKEMGTLYFQFKDGIRMIGYVFFAYSYTGELIDECDETRPFWCKKSDLDYSMMWEDDRLWLPLAMEGKHFEGYFVFDDKTMLDQKIVVEDE